MLFCIYQENTIYSMWHVHGLQIELLLFPWLHDKEIDGKRDFLSYKLKRRGRDYLSVLRTDVLKPL